MGTSKDSLSTINESKIRIEVFCMTVFDMANHYYNHVPRLWDKSRIEALVRAGRLTEQEAKEIMSEKPET